MPNLGLIHAEGNCMRLTTARFRDMASAMAWSLLTIALLADGLNGEGVQDPEREKTADYSIMIPANELEE